MQATITYLLTEQAQRAQMVATGQPVARKQSITVEVSADDLALMQVKDDGTPYLDLATEWPHEHADILRSVDAVENLEGRSSKSGNLLTNCYQAFREPNPDILALLRAGRDKLQAEEHRKREKEDAAIRAFLASDTPVTDRYYARHLPDNSDISGRRDELAQQFMAEAARRLQVHEAREAAKRVVEAAAKEKRNEELEQAKQAYIAAWIEQNGDELTREQFAEGLLSRQAALNMIAAAAFSEHGIPEAAPDPAVCEGSGCPCGAKTVASLPRKVYPTWRELKAKLPKGSDASFTRIRECLRDDEGYYDGEGDSAGAPYYAAEIKMPHGPFVFERTIRL